jgi:signal transduction histidine kinase
MNGIEFPMSFALLFFIYGLAFFCMGLAMVLETRRVPLLAGPRVLHLFALFFFLNGINGWVDVGILFTGWVGSELIKPLYGVRIVLLIISFSFLLLFGARAMHPVDRNSQTIEKVALAGLIGFYIVLVGLIVKWQNYPPDDSIAYTTMFVRYALAIPGSSLAAVALWRISQGTMAIANQQLRLFLRLVSVCFFLFGVSQIFISITPFFLRGYSNPDFSNISGLYIQSTRSILALVMTLGLIRVSQLVDDERQRQFEAAQQARLDALRRIEEEMVEREAMRQELMRHIVMAQEDERSRIARELHDETAQFLTAFSLNLATVQNTIKGNGKVNALLENLQNLSKSMSQGIHRMVYDLRPAQLDDLGLVAALQSLIEEKRRTGLDVRFEIDGLSQRLDPLIETVIFRIAQEALTNVSKHAQSQQATLKLQTGAEQVSLRVHDLGVGFDPDQKQRGEQGWGLVGMKERVESVGGIFQVYSAINQGTLIEVVIPMNDIDIPGKRSDAHYEHDQTIVSR